MIFFDYQMINKEIKLQNFDFCWFLIKKFKKKNARISDKFSIVVILYEKIKHNRNYSHTSDLGIFFFLLFMTILSKRLSLFLLQLKFIYLLLLFGLEIVY